MKSEALGTENISSLLLKQALPASIGFMVMSVYILIDTIFIGKYVGSLGIGAVSVVMTISFLISSIGMGIGIGGSSIVSRSLGEGNKEKANLAFGNQISMTVTLSVIVFVFGWFFSEPILDLFGAKGEILPIAKSYFKILLFGIPFLAWLMMSNNNMRAEGKAKKAMNVMLISALSNIILDYLFIVVLDKGIEGAAWATNLGYFSAAIYIIYYFFISGKSELKATRKDYVIDLKILKEILSIGGVTMIRQGSISLFAIILNYSLFKYGELQGVGGEVAISVYGIVNRMAMFVFFPVIGITQGFMPIAGYNFGAQLFSRVKEVIYTSVKWGATIGVVICATLILFAKEVTQVFTHETILLNETPTAITWIFIASPLIIIQILSSSYYQAIGKALPALMLTLTKQFFFLVPIVLILPYYYGLNGIWYSFAISDILSGAVCAYYLFFKASKKLSLA